jgi:Glycolipid 2-alpha-mannosyltransferase
MPKRSRTNSTRILYAAVIVGVLFVVYITLALETIDEKQNNNFPVPSRFQVDEVHGGVQRDREVRINALHETPGRQYDDRIPKVIWHKKETLCKTNAIVILAQKKHSTYNRDSYGLLVKALDLLFTNYLLIDKHYENVDIFIFHTGEFSKKDLTTLEQRHPEETWGTMRLVNIGNTLYWEVPAHLLYDNRRKWNPPPSEYSIGYRNMCRWYTLKLWDYFDYLNRHYGCEYRYIMRMDEDSFLQSPIAYDLFDYMVGNNFLYGFRMCSYELLQLKRVWLNYVGRHSWLKYLTDEQVPLRVGNFQSLCGMYNNWAIADLTFFLSPKVQHFFQWVDLEGVMYRERIGDLLLHSAAVYAFAPANQVVRFLDFSYEHFSRHHKGVGAGCPFWGAYQAGYNDANGTSAVRAFAKREMEDNDICVALDDPIRPRLGRLSEEFLQPDYYQTNIPDAVKGNLKLWQFSAGLVETASARMKEYRQVIK